MKAAVSWEEIKKRVYDKEEVENFDAKLDLICSVIEARTEKGLSQKELEEKSGVKQPIIARLEKGRTSTQIDTILKILGALGKTLKVVDIRKDKHA